MDTPDVLEALRLGEPIAPLTKVAACTQAARLRRRFPDMSYPNIAAVLEAYHGVKLKPEQVRYACVARGAPRRWAGRPAFVPGRR